MAWVEKRGPWYRVRYREPDGTVRTTPDKYRGKKDADKAASELDTDQRRGVFIDPKDSRTTLADWATVWRQSHRVAPSTKAKYDNHLDHHIIPAFGDYTLEGIGRQAVKQWANGLADRYAPATTSSIVTLLSVILTDAVDNRMIPINPCQNLRLAGRDDHTGPVVRRRRVITDTQALHVARRVGAIGGRRMEIMVITAMFTGMRWGELAGLARDNCQTSNGFIFIDPEVGALHEVGGRMWLGPPKSEAAERRIDLPPFLCDLLEEVMDGHEHEQVFVSAELQWLRRSNFTRRIWRPACDGDPTIDPAIPPIAPGAVFHGLRHLHKSMMIELDTERVLQFDRLGHELSGIDGVYSHVTDRMRKRLTAQLQQRWAKLIKTPQSPEPRS